MWATDAEVEGDRISPIRREYFRLVSNNQAIAQPLDYSVFGLSLYRFDMLDDRSQPATP